MAQTVEKPARLQKIPEIVDSDFHLTEKQSDLMPYLPNPWKKMFTRGSTGDDYGVLSTLYPLPGSVNTVTMGKVQSDTVNTREHVRAGMEKFYIDRAITTPTLNLLLGTVRNEEIAGALATAFNRWQADTIVAAEDGIYGTILVPPQNPEVAVAEIEEWADTPEMVGVFMPPTGAVPFFGHPVYHPIYEAAEREGLPMLFHNSASGVAASFPHLYKFLSRYFSLHTVSHPIQHICNVTDVITRGLTQKFPDIDWIIQEGGLGYIPFLMHRMDHQYHQNDEDIPSLDRLPSEVLKEKFYFTSQPIEGTDNPEYVRSMVEHMGGSETLMFSSDYPHFDFDNTDELLSLLSTFDDEDINRIYGGTAREVLAF